MSTDPTVIVAGARTPMGRLLGSLAGFSGAQLGGFAIRGALEKAGIVFIGPNVHAIEAMGGFLIRVDRPGLVAGSHPSEQEQARIVAHWTVRNEGDLIDLETALTSAFVFARDLRMASKTPIGISPLIVRSNAHTLYLPGRHPRPGIVWAL